MQKLRFSNGERSLILLGHLSLIVTIILACIFYKERILYTDPGQQLFEMINNNDFRIYANRYSMAINQLIPLAAIKLGLSLKIIAICYSLSFVIIYYLCFLLCTYGFKNSGAGLAIALVPIIVRTAFGHSISEAWLGVAYSAVFYAILNHYDEWRKKGTRFIVLFYFLCGIIVAINFYIHPITLFTLAFALGFTYLRKKQYRDIHIYMVSLFVIGPYLYNFLFPSHVHDEGFFTSLRIAPSLLPQLLKLPIWDFIASQFINIYIVPIVLIIWIVMSSWRNKNILSLAFSFFFICLYLIVVSITFYKGEPRYSLESRLIPLEFMIIIPLIENIKNKQKFQFRSLMILSILVFCYFDLCKQMNEYHTSRIKLYEKLLVSTENYTERKFYIYYSNTQTPPVNSWGSAVETLILSSLNDKENSKSIVFVLDETKVEEGLTYWPCVFIWVPWYMYIPEEKINKQYFDLKCSSYKKLPYSIVE